MVIDTNPFDVVSAIDIHGRPWGVAITPDGKKVYAANGLANDVAVIDTATNRLVRTIKAGDGAWGAAVVPPAR